ncbi:MAG: 4Fe-4S binding protein, partial [Lachnospiraceae bacterium]|nr:4Fe-4S binding protein [Lachnospiraceae bacterium]
MAVMTFAGAALKNFFSKPVTTKYPAEPAEYKERTRGHIEISIDDCIGCGMCTRCCPCGTLSIDKIKGTWTINRFDCIACGFCVEKCPKKCLTMVAGYQTPDGEKETV